MAQTEGDPQAVFVGLGAEKHLDRERALRRFQQIIQDTHGTPAAAVTPMIRLWPVYAPAGSSSDP
jgi:hypothetical protein